MKREPIGLLWQDGFYYLKFIYEKLKNSFLDVVMKLNEGNVVNDIYREPVSSRQYHYFASWHVITFKDLSYLPTIHIEKNML